MFRRDIPNKKKSLKFGRVRQLRVAPEHLLLASATRVSAIPQIVVMLLFAFAIVVMVFVNVFKVDKIVVSNGKLVTLQPPTTLKPLQAGIVETVSVRPGDHVSKGQLLVRLNTSIGDIESKKALELSDAYSSRISRLRGTIIDSKTTAFAESERRVELLHGREQEAAIARLKFDIETKKVDVSTLESKLPLALRAVALETAQLSRLSNLLKDGLVPLADVEKADESLGQRKMELLESRQQLAASRIALTSALNALDEYRIKTRKEDEELLRTTMMDNSGATADVEKANFTKNLSDVRAPYSGNVLDVMVDQGSSVGAVQPVISIIPDHQPLEAEIQIANEDVGSIPSFATGRIKIDAFPAERYGALSGVVRVISLDSRGAQAQDHQDFQDNLKDKDRYIGYIRITSNHMHSVEQPFALRAGMRVTVELKVGKRSIAEYIFDPIFRKYSETFSDR